MYICVCVYIYIYVLIHVFGVVFAERDVAFGAVCYY